MGVVGVSGEVFAAGVTRRDVLDAVGAANRVEGAGGAGAVGGAGQGTAGKRKKKMMKKRSQHQNFSLAQQRPLVAGALALTRTLRND